MEAIRTIQNVANGEIHLQLPRAFWGQQVEVIVLATPSPVQKTAKPAQKSLRGALKAHANPNLIPLESGAWAAEVRDPQ
ncbi:hypothetical protein AB4090_06265 [Acidithiobacillus sp. IBUN Pt1247-S3]|uniref:hypothetical protein n=1 Tax=Acidithiobacillus sp. IBUN Pt1247-S3 TaxID=3166642 RepID=UPI0034E4F1C1